MIKKKITGAVCALLAGLLLGACSPMLAFTARSMAPDTVPQPVDEVTAYYGPFDEICLFRYYSTDSTPDGDRIPGSYDDGDGTWSLSEIEGPVETPFGACWEARYSME